VQAFVHHLEACAVDVVYDKYLDDRIKSIHGRPFTYAERDGHIMRIIGRMAFCHIFMPLFTPGYLEGIGYPEGQPTRHSFTIGWVLDEFQLSCRLGSMRRIETIPILRRGDPAKLPPGFTAANTLDLRSGDDYGQKLAALGVYMHERRLVARVPDLQKYEEYWEREP
jgi:hypothetical protein